MTVVRDGDDYEALARVFKALGDKTRLRLVAELARRGQVTCGEFATMCACSDSALTYHQRVLSDAGLIAVRRAGQFRVLTLRHGALEALLPGFLARLACPDDDAALLPPPLFQDGDGDSGGAGAGRKPVPMVGELAQPMPSA